MAGKFKNKKIECNRIKRVINLIAYSCWTSHNRSKVACASHLTLIMLASVVLNVAPNSSVAQQSPLKDFRYYYQKGMKACEEGRLSDCQKQLARSNHLRPGHQIIMYQLAKVLARNGAADSSIFYLSRAVAIKADLDLQDSSFASLENNSGFQSLLLQKSKLLEPVNRSREFLKLQERDLHIESIAYDQVENRFFLGSVHKRKILQYFPDSERLEEFVAEGQDNIGSVFGMKVDQKRNLLWICSVSTPYMKPTKSERRENSAIYKYDLDSNRLVKVYKLQFDTLQHWFGDLTLHPASGDVYISDSRTNNIFRITMTSDSLELFMAPKGMLSLQGLDFDQDGSYLYLSDYVKGIFKIDVNSHEMLKLKEPGPPLSLKSIDGLYFYRNSLITTQNQVHPMRVSRYYLNRDQTRVDSVKYLEKVNPQLDEPTLGVIVGSKFYYVGTSQWGGYQENHQPKPWKDLKDISILETEL